MLTAKNSFDNDTFTASAASTSSAAIRFFQLFDAMPLLDESIMRSGSSAELPTTPLAPAASAMAHAGVGGINTVAPPSHSPWRFIRSAEQTSEDTRNRNGSKPAEDSNDNGSDDDAGGSSQEASEVDKTFREHIARELLAGNHASFSVYSRLMEDELGFLKPSRDLVEAAAAVASVQHAETSEVAICTQQRHIIRYTVSVAASADFISASHGLGFPLMGMNHPSRDTLDSTSCVHADHSQAGAKPTVSIAASPQKAPLRRSGATTVQTAVASASKSSERGGSGGTTSGSNNSAESVATIRDLLHTSRRLDVVHPSLVVSPLALSPVTLGVCSAVEQQSLIDTCIEVRDRLPTLRLCVGSSIYVHIIIFSRPQLSTYKWCYSRSDFELSARITFTCRPSPVTRQQLLIY
jgi:hypothetical protein